MFKITSQLKLCRKNITDDDMFEEIFFTLHVSNIILQQQYLQNSFKK